MDPLLRIERSGRRVVTGVENFLPSVADDDVVNWGRRPFAPPLFWIMKWQIIAAASFGAFLGVLCPSGFPAAKDLAQQLNRTSPGAWAPKTAPNNSTVAACSPTYLACQMDHSPYLMGGLCYDLLSPTTRKPDNT